MTATYNPFDQNGKLKEFENMSVLDFEVNNPPLTGVPV